MSTHLLTVLSRTEKVKKSLTEQVLWKNLWQMRCRTHNDGTYHIYDIRKNIKDTANRINGLERPIIDEGNALQNGISTDSISKTKETVNENVGV